MIHFQHLLPTTVALVTSLLAWFRGSVREPVPIPIRVDERRGERGASLVEYALLVSLIALVCVAAVAMLGGVTGEKYSSVLSGF